MLLWSLLIRTPQEWARVLVTELIRTPGLQLIGASSWVQHRAAPVAEKTCSLRVQIAAERVALLVPMEEVNVCMVCLLASVRDENARDRTCKIHTGEN